MVMTRAYHFFFSWQYRQNDKLHAVTFLRIGLTNTLIKVTGYQISIFQWEFSKLNEVWCDRS